MHGIGKWGMDIVKLQLPDGRVLSVKGLRRITGISENAIRGRIRSNWTVEDILNTPAGKKRLTKESQEKKNLCNGCKHWRTSGSGDAKSQFDFRFCNYIFD